MTTRRSAVRAAARIAALATAAILTLSGCAAGGSSTGTAAPASLTWGWALPTSWDPVTSTAGWDTHALALVYDGLTQLDTEGEVVPGLAEKWAYSADGTAVTFTLRGALFSDGTAVTADAVKRNLERGRDQADSTIAGQLKVVTGVEVEDEKTVTVRLDQADYQIPISAQSSASGVLLRAETVVVHLLDAHDIDVAKLGATSGVDRFAEEHRWSRLVTGEPVYHDVRAWVRCAVIGRMDAGGSTVIAAHALQSRLQREVRSGENGDALVYHNRAWHRLGEHSRIG